jgi:IS30 family transposase
VDDKLWQQWSPMAISQRLRRDFPGDERMRISHETIYRWVYKDASLGGKFYRNLRRRHKKRRRQKRYGTGRRFVNCKRISERPEIVATRQRFGDWEGDTIAGQRNSGLIATIVERKSRYLLAAKLDNKKAATLTAKGIKAFIALPRKMRKTLTVDNGSEFARFRQLEEETGLEIYFADPYAAWQRGTNENTNGLLRQYFPKGWDFRTVTDSDVKDVVRSLNNRPRKCLNYQTPHEVFWKEARGALAS